MDCRHLPPSRAAVSLVSRPTIAAAPPATAGSTSASCGKTSLEATSDCGGSSKNDSHDDTSGFTQQYSTMSVTRIFA